MPSSDLPWTRPSFWLASAGVVAGVATVGSLYLSLGLGLVPCRLCWYQRILMYPLVVVLAVATLEQRSAVARTVTPLAVAGAAIAAYHSWLQLGATRVCSVGRTSCGLVQYREPVLGLTVPNVSLVAFVLVLGAVWVAHAAESTTRGP